MRTRVYGYATCAVALLTLGIAVPANAAPRTPPVSYGTSCIDGNANGVCGDSVDTPLAHALDTNGMYLDGQHGSHSGLVLQGSVRLPLFVYIQVTKNVVISGAISETGDDVGGTVETLHGNVTVQPGTTFSLTTSLELNAYDSAALIDIGAGSKAKVSGDNVDLTMHSHGTMHVASNQNDAISGGGYAGINFFADLGLTVDPHQTFKGSHHGAFEFDGGGDLTLDTVNWNAGYVLINNFGSTAHPGGRNLLIANSTLVQNYKNGNMHVYADTPSLGSIRIEHSTLIAKDADGGIFNPFASCVASTAPSWVCP